MYFLLHHPTGTLMLDAQDKSSVLSWTERQLGGGACRAAVVEVGDEVATGFVENSGTGVSRSGCAPLISVTADSIQRVAGADITGLNGLDRFLVPSFVVRKSTFH